MRIPIYAANRCPAHCTNTGRHEQAFAVLVDRYKNGLYRHCLRFTKDESSAEDIALEAFVEAYKHMNSYNPQFRFTTWLYKIATNLALSSLRKRKDIRLDERELERIVSERPVAEDLIFYKELHEAVDRLPLTYRTVVSMYYWQGKSYTEIANHMGTSVGSIKGWMHRARKLLRGELSLISMIFQNKHSAQILRPMSCVPLPSLRNAKILASNTPL